MTRRLLILGLAVLMAVPLAGCGRKGNPEEPEDAVYPRTYPYTPLPSPPKAADGGDKAGQPFQAPQPRRTRPNELKPPAAEPGRPQ
ncbi:MAG: hypothetical protein EPN20_16090 [Magnetospirillum sp.]|nr:MAG: hypothetical protein EPN20_16090 [Magnetospirillum sp.]